LVDRFGDQRVANGLLCVEYFPYHSEHFGFDRTLPSQLHSFALVRAALERNAVIISLRAWSQWKGAVPELANYERAFRLRNAQRAWVTRGNCPDGFDSILDALATLV
jgi:hypothetical protein